MAPSDPALHGKLRSRLASLKASPEFTAYLDSIKDKRIALILSGGGAKGAYEAGAILALFDCGIRKYAAMAGTSVGGLNAVLAHELSRIGDTFRSQIIDLWSTISFRRVLALNVWLLPFIVFIAILRGLATLQILIVNRLFGVSGIRIADISSLDSTRHRFYGQLLQVTFLLVLGSILFTMHYFTSFASVELAFIVTLLAVATPIFSNWIGRYLSWFSNKPLRKKIEAMKLDDVHHSRIPIFVTFAVDSELWDPFEAHNSPEVSDYARRFCMIPLYRPLNLSDNEAELREWLLQTAAIPEVFPKRPVRGIYVVDGGIADNTPMLALLDHNLYKAYRIDMWMVIYLRYYSESHDDLYKEETKRTLDIAEITAASHEVGWRGAANDVRRRHWNRLHNELLKKRLDRAQEIGDGAATEEYLKQYDHVMESLRADPPRFSLVTSLFPREQFFPIVPTRRLWGKLGTMLFFSWRAKQLMRLGYSDTLDRLEQAAKKMAVRP